jgi:hypothetical protein
MSRTLKLGGRHLAVGFAKYQSSSASWCNTSRWMPCARIGKRHFSTRGPHQFLIASRSRGPTSSFERSSLRQVVDVPTCGGAEVPPSATIIRSVWPSDVTGKMRRADGSSSSHARSGCHPSRRRHMPRAGTNSSTVGMPKPSRGVRHRRVEPGDVLAALHDFLSL